MKSFIFLSYLALSLLHMQAFGDEQTTCRQAEEVAHDCCSNPKSCMSHGELKDVQKLELLIRQPANDSAAEEIKDLQSDLNQDAMDNCHKAVKYCRSSCSDVDLKLVQKCAQHSAHSEMFKQQMNSVIIPGAQEEARE